MVNVKLKVVKLVYSRCGLWDTLCYLVGEYIYLINDWMFSVRFFLGGGKIEN